MNNFRTSTYPCESCKHALTNVHSSTSANPLVVDVSGNLYPVPSYNGFKSVVDLDDDSGGGPSTVSSPSSEALSFRKLLVLRRNGGNDKESKKEDPCDPEGL